MKMTALNVPHEDDRVYEFRILIDRNDILFINPEVLYELNKPSMLSDKIAILAYIAKMLETGERMINETLYGQPDPDKKVVGLLAADDVIIGEIIE
jgi:hypothetical protein